MEIEYENDEDSDEQEENNNDSENNSNNYDSDNENEDFTNDNDENDYNDDDETDDDENYDDGNQNDDEEEKEQVVKQYEVSCQEPRRNLEPSKFYTRADLMLPPEIQPKVNVRPKREDVLSYVLSTKNYGIVPCYVSPTPVLLHSYLLSSLDP